MPQNTNLNISPYFDDFDKDKNFIECSIDLHFQSKQESQQQCNRFYRIRLENMGQHFFKEGAMVIPGQVGYDLNA